MSPKLAAALLVLWSVAVPARADDTWKPLADKPWSVSAGLGTGSASGGYGSFLEKPVASDFNLYRDRGPWRFGVGIRLGSLAMKAPYQDELEWAHHEFYLNAARTFRPSSRVQPYFQIQAGLARQHPRSEVFATAPLDSFEPGDSPTLAANGFGLTLQPGARVWLNPAFGLDVAGFYKVYSSSAYDLTAIGRPPVDSGSWLGAQLGLVWRPQNGAASRRGVANVDAWGVPRSYGWAAAETMAINIVASAAIEYVRGANFTQMSPRSNWDNFKEGFTFDDNQFKTNQYSHPFNGAGYFNASRANGLDFWRSSGFAMAGAFMWECCGETHPMSLNDQVATGIGGIALGEMQYRLSSAILNNQATGLGRWGREIGAFLVDPVRGFNRAVSGRWTRVADNPTDPNDFRPKRFATLLSSGVRVIGEGNSISENTQTYAFVELDVDSGSSIDADRRKPFDHYDVGLQLNFGDKVGLGRVQIRGDLYSRALGSADQPKHAFAITQQFDYVNNTAYEFGGQSLGPTLFSRFDLSQKLKLVTRADGFFTMMGAVDSKYAFLADVADREHFRDYDYGPGGGVSASAALVRSGRPLLQVLYRLQYLNVRNGSVYNKNDEIGSDAEHTIQLFGARLVVPIHKNLALGADGILFVRDSRYSLAVLADIHRRNPQARVYLALSSSR